MRILELMDRKAIGLGFAVYLVVFGLGLLMVGPSPSDGEMHLIFWPAVIASVTVGIVVVRRGAPEASRRRRDGSLGR